jgi:hypothetical protein
MIEIFLGALVLLVVVMSGRRWMQTRRSGTGSRTIGVDEASSFRDRNHMARRAHDGDAGTGPF